MKLIGFEPTGEEQAAILRCRKRYKLVAGGEQSGKSYCASADFIIHFFEDRQARPGEPLLYWLVAADYDRTKAEFNYIADFLTRLGFHVDPSKVVNPGLIEVRVSKKDEKPFCRIETKSGKDPRTLSMFAPNGIIGCESSQLDLDTYFKCLARLAPKNGWFHMAGTFEGSLGWYPGLAKAWSFGTQNEQSFRLPATTNWHLYPQGIETPTLKRLREDARTGYSDAFFLERIMGIASPPKNIVFDEFRPDIHIRDLEYDPFLPVIICHDPGYSHANAIEILQVQQEQVCVIDEIWRHGVGTTDLIGVCMKRPWWKGEKSLVIDPHYATQHQGDRSVAEIWLALTGLVNTAVRVKIAAGTERMKTYLKVDVLSGKPGIVFNGRLRPDEATGAMRPTCAGVLSELGAYPSPLDGQTHVYSNKVDAEGNVTGDGPVDRFNDGCKAIIYGLVAEFGLVQDEGNAEYVT